MDRRAFRARVLQSCGAGPAEVEELLHYNDNVFQQAPASGQKFPLEDEPFVAAWSEYVAEASRDGLDVCLKRRLVQFRFPIRSGMGESEEYRNATRRGELPPQSGEGLVFQRPDLCRLVLHHTAAGRIPLLILGDRSDFVACVQALTKRNEPVPIPPSMGASMVAGYNNWDRIRQVRADWERGRAGSTSDADWAFEWQRIIPQKHLYQDRFILLSDGPYSGVSAEAMEMTPDEWRAISLIIRREHECTHYFTRRVFASMRNNLIDELLADYSGIVAAAGTFHSSWLLRFLGLENFPEYRRGGRLENYRGDPPLSESAFLVLTRIVQRAAMHVEEFHRTHEKLLERENIRSVLIMTLAEFTAEELASEEVQELLSTSLRRRLELTQVAQASNGASFG